MPTLHTRPSPRLATVVAALLTLCTASALACAQATARPTAAAAQPAVPPPRLVVLITIDQLRADYLDRFAPQLTGGIGRLMRTGAVFTQAAHDYATTETAPGHATLWSGRLPMRTGIVRNDIGVTDPQMPLLFGRGSGASPFRFRGTAIFDWIRTTDPWARALSVSRKDRGAILPLGREKQQAYWYSTDGRFTTSRYYGDTVPTWVTQFNERDFLSRYRGKEWTLLLDASQYPEPDSVPAENRGRTFVFPHRMPTELRAAGSELPEFPWMDDVTVELALEGVHRMELGAGPSTDLLAVSLSTMDAIGHRYGPDSRELHDHMLRLDRAVGVLIDSLYSMRDSSTIVFALSSDHGVAPFPELHFAGSERGRGRVDARLVIDSTRSRLVARGVGPDALTLETGLVFLDRTRLAERGINADSVVTAIRTGFLRLPGVSRVDRVESLAGLAAKGDTVARRWVHSIPPDFGVVLTVTLEPYWTWVTYTSAAHGKPHDYDAVVPVIFAGPTIRPGRYREAIRTVDVAPTLAAIIGVKPTEPLDGQVLGQVIARPTIPAERILRRRN